MILLRNTAAALIWYLRMLRQLLRAQRGRTLTLIAVSAVVRITGMLAFMIPLKVILLAGSDRVPRYMPFIDTNYRMEWIVGLSVAAIGFYLLTLALESLAERLATAGGREVLEAANDMAVRSSQREEACDTFASLCQIAADCLFAGLALGVMVLVNPGLFAYLAALSVLGYAFTALALRGWTPARSRPLARFIVEKRSDYLSFWSSGAFLSGFLVLLAPFLMGAEANLLITIITFLLLRRALRSVFSAINTVARQFQNQVRVEALLFRSRQWLPVESSSARTLRDLFSPSERQHLIEQQLGALMEIAGPPQVRWIDTDARNLSRFTAAVPLRSGDTAQVLVHVVSRRGIHLFENERLLFDHIPRERLAAAPLLTQFEHADFTCQVLDAGTGRFVTGGEWKRALPGYLADRWSVAPPTALVRAYRASHRLLYERIDESVLSGLAFVCDRPEEVAMLDELRARLGDVRKTLSSLPLVIAKSDLGPDTVMHGADGALLTTGWGQWRLSPIGADIGDGPAVNLEAMLEEVRKRRRVPAHLSVAHLRFARLSRKLLHAADRDRYREGLAIARQLLHHPALEQAKKPAKKAPARASRADRPVS